jgi:hypothetical protein
VEGEAGHGERGRQQHQRVALGHAPGDNNMCTAAQCPTMLDADVLHPLQ